MASVPPLKELCTVHLLLVFFFLCDFHYFTLAHHRVSSSSVVRASGKITGSCGFKSHLKLRFFSEFSINAISISEYSILYNYIINNSYLAGIYIVIKLVTRWFTCISRFHNHRQLPLVAISHWADKIKNKFLKKQMSRNLFIYYFMVNNLLLTFKCCRQWQWQMKLLTKQGIIKSQTECAPNNGYFLIPLYDKVCNWCAYSSTPIKRPPLGK